MDQLCGEKNLHLNKGTLSSHLSLRGEQVEWQVLSLYSPSTIPLDLYLAFFQGSEMQEILLMSCLTPQNYTKANRNYWYVSYVE